MLYLYIILITTFKTNKMETIEKQHAKTRKIIKELGQFEEEELGIETKEKAEKIKLYFSTGLIILIVAIISIF